MPKVFVALDLPDFATLRLVELQPKPLNGIRLVRHDQMHLTLHFVGEADRDRTAKALEKVRVQPFSLQFKGVGQFPSAGESVTLWAAFQESAGLLELHAAVASALSDEGFRPEARRYTPHVTLARCEPGIPRRVVEEFLVAQLPTALQDVPVERFSLYSSVLGDAGPEYRSERSYFLRS